jgi:hypothetical protein
VRTELSFPRCADDSPPISPRNLFQGVVVESPVTKRGNQAWKPLRPTEFIGHGRSVKIGAKSDVFHASSICNITDVPHDLRQWRIRVTAAVWTKESDVIVDANDAPRISNGVNLRVG